MSRIVQLLTRSRLSRIGSIRSSHQLSRISTIVPKQLSIPPGNQFPTINYSQKVHTPPEETLLDLKLYEGVCSETLEELNDYFEEILENTSCLDSVPDITYSVSILQLILFCSSCSPLPPPFRMAF